MAPFAGLRTCLLPDPPPAGTPPARGTRITNLLPTAMSPAAAAQTATRVRRSRHSESPLMSALFHSNGGGGPILRMGAPRAPPDREGHPPVLRTGPMRAASHC